MRTSLCFTLAMSLFAGTAEAQTPAASPAPAAATPKAGDTLSGVTVMPVPKRICSSRDKDCIAMVVAELQRRYPEQLKQFCFAEQTKAARTQFTNDQLLESLNGNGPPTPTAAPVNPIVKTACASDKK